MRQLGQIFKLFIETPTAWTPTLDSLLQNTSILFMLKSLYKRRDFMCGIAGLANISSHVSPISINLLDAMQRAIAHRGPNGYQLWTDQHNQYGIAHRRLSILDLSPAGNQPMMNADGSVIVACNGEIYNFKKLRAELERLGYRFISGSDTEVIVHAYQAWGIDCLKRFEGMFAVAIIDLNRDELYLIRDRFGIKPLYFSTTGGQLSFASEIKALWPLPWMHKKINGTALYHYLTYLVTPAPLTLYEGIYKLPAGHYLRLSAKKEISFVQWYCIADVQHHDTQYTYGSDMQVAKTVLSLVRESVHKQMVSDVPVGAFLSGGIDSSMIVSLMSEVNPTLKTFNISFSDGSDLSELTWARKVARTFNTDHHELIISEADAFAFFQSMVYHQDEPIADCVCIPLYYVSKLARDAGVKVALVGEGSDELFCGYPSYGNYINLYQRYWKTSQQFVPAFARKGAYYALKALWHMQPAYVDKLYDWAYNRSLFWSGATMFSEHAKHELFKGVHTTLNDPIVHALYPDLQQEWDSYSFVAYHLQKLRSLRPNSDFLSAMVYLEFQQRLPELLLTRVDKMTMAASIEARVPFLEHRLAEYVFSMPTEYKYRNGITKYILKKAAESVLPYDIIYRPKVGFSAPIMRWFAHGNYFKPNLQSLLADKSCGWDEYLDMRYINGLLKNYNPTRYQDALALWTVQNVLSVTLP